MVKAYLSLGDIRRTISLVKPFILQHRAAYLLLLFLLTLNIGLTLAFAWFYGNILDAAVHIRFQQLIWLVPTGISLVVLSIASSYCRTCLETAATSGVKRELKQQLFKHILLLSPKEAAAFRTGDLLSHFTYDIHGLDGVIGRSLLDLIQVPLIYAAVFVYLLHINWKLCLLTLLIAPAALLAGAVFGLQLRRNSKQFYSLTGKLSSLMNETFHGMPVVRSFSIESKLFRNFSNQNQELYDLEFKNAKLSGWYHIGSFALGSIAFLVSLILGAYFISIDKMTVGTLITYVSLVHYLVNPLTGLAGQWAGLQKSIAAAERICKVLETPIQSTDLPAYQSTKPLLHAIRFQNVTFSYDGKTPVFEQLHLQLPAGKVVAIVGRSGAGKTTLFNLLQGFYPLDSGVIWLDNVRIDRLTPSELRGYFGHVPQESFLFDGTIRENLMLARPAITEQEMIKAARAANIHSYIEDLPNGYDTEIGEAGVRLSGGQKQRLAIARAILKDAPILLLDEATASLDLETEYQVKEALARLMHNRTTLIISHRLSTIRNADLIVVIEQGKVVEMGSHGELMESGGLYSRLDGTYFAEQIDNRLIALLK